MYHPVGIDAERVGRDIVIASKLRVFEKLLQDYPEWIGNVVMIQVTSPALTDSPKSERMVSEIVAHINGEYGGLYFVPVHQRENGRRRQNRWALPTRKRAAATKMGPNNG